MLRAQAAFDSIANDLARDYPNQDAGMKLRLSPAGLFGESVEPVQFRLLYGALQNAKPMAKREDLKLRCRSSLEKRQRCCKQRR